MEINDIEQVTVDKSRMLEFFTGLASVFHRNGQLSSEHSENLRASLTKYDAKGPLIPWMHQHQIEFLDLLDMRFGGRKFGLNLLRYSLVRQIRDLRESMAALGHEMIRQSQLVFNRKMMQQGVRGAEGQVLMSALLVDYADGVYSACEDLERISRQSNLWVPHGMNKQDSDDQIDLQSAEILGFVSVDPSLTPFLRAEQVMSSLGLVLLGLSRLIHSLTESLSENPDWDPAIKLGFIADQLRQESLRLREFTFPVTEKISSWEVARQSCVNGLYRARLAAGMAETVMRELSRMKAIEGKQGTDEVPIHEGLRRRVSYHLVGVGHGIEPARDAAEKMMDLLQSTGLKPQEILPSELTKAHPLLDKRCLELVASSDEREKENAQKKSVLFRCNDLIRKFSAILPCLVAFVFLGCGVKTAPVSTLVDLRPEVPRAKLITDSPHTQSGEKDGAQGNLDSDSNALQKRSAN